MISVITTIVEPTPCVKKLADHLRLHQSEMVVVGDKKGPSMFQLDGSHFLSLNDQYQLPYELAKLLPTGHYARKNLGYLWAFSKAAPCIYETDDDNAPNGKWIPRQKSNQAKRIKHSGWLNVYKFFSDDLIWPRGLPLNKAREQNGAVNISDVELLTIAAPVQQGLADLSPDVDAVWRLVCDRPFYFQDGPNVYLEPGTWCPFNSQNTWWWPEAYVLMYLPSYCSFRMTDIWRGFIAQRCLWAMGKGLLFFAADVVQERNLHNLQKDFEAEIPGYIGNGRMVEMLQCLHLEDGLENVGNNLLACYEALVKADFFPSKELELVQAWLRDTSQLPGS